MYAYAALEYEGLYRRGIFSQGCNPFVSICVEYPVKNGAYGNDRATGRVDIAAGMDDNLGFYEVKHRGNEALADKQLDNYIEKFNADPSNYPAIATKGEDLVERTLSEPDPLDPKNKTLYARYVSYGYIEWWTENDRQQSGSLYDHWKSADYMPQWLRTIVAPSVEAPGSPVVGVPEVPVLVP